MEQMRARKSPERQAKIDAMRAEISGRDMDIAAHVLTCITRGNYFNADEVKQKHPRALEFAYLFLGDDRGTT